MYVINYCILCRIITLNTLHIEIKNLNIISIHMISLFMIKDYYK